MPELEPITREEKFLNGEVGMTPITREEKILAGEDIETITRREYFLKKYRGGGGGDVTVVPLSVTDNGTYSEEGKAYSPVSVNVPLPQNAYLLKSVANLPQAIASFNDGEEMVMPSLKVAIEPQQEGSGDPSTTNVRPISGWDEVEVTVADATTDPTVENIYTIDLDGTRYGGEVDVVNGVLTVDRVEVDMGTLNWSKSSLEATILFIAISDRKAMSPMICSKYKYVRDKGFGLDFGTISDSSSSSYKNYIFVRNQDFLGKTATECASILNGTQLVYELATPLTIQLTPTAIKFLRGVNNVWANTGDIKDAEYFSKEV